MRPRPKPAATTGEGKGTAEAAGLRSPILRVRARLAKRMWGINRTGTPEHRDAAVAALRALAQAIEAVEKLEGDHG